MNIRKWSTVYTDLELSQGHLKQGHDGRWQGLEALLVDVTEQKVKP